ncbi:MULTISPECIES: HU family DNA-binding protein [Ralstonia]|jgi:nucleoid DNA-binding protein|uniref:DNA-binding protein HU-beta n=3 Tax=Pseudomonadota TaxID=1224 RepID=A0AAD2BRY5_9RALS|nr:MULTISPECIES: HU family DNA-binding protein [Ralstonia]NOZ17967.1 HU family DNA-binding protein [Betaproteobacteria bacterium]AJW47590.1 hypothetical protein TK49_22965 [Ralstonia mannitolilytica]MBA9871423.1 HU family DNA-binding protein [Ralstonia insidiosa]MBA9915677.1 HU family DNA-binding protein [Ralstonia insidiosa]MBA9954668.1 HU family DNA-binding protein [Ralstonia insidiosa]
MTTKAELVIEIAAHSGESKATVERVLASFVDAVTKSVARGDEAGLPGLGAFSRSLRDGRTGRNPRTGEQVEIAPRWTPRFRAAKALRDAMPAPTKAKSK